MWLPIHRGVSTEGLPDSQRLAASACLPNAWCTVDQASIVTPQEHIEFAKRRKDWAWQFFQVMTNADRKAFDSWLVEQRHPIAYEPGTTESRFRRMIQS